MIQFRNKGAVVLLLPLTFGPEVTESFAVIHVTEDDIARLNPEFGDRLANQNAIRFIGDVYTRQTGDDLSLFECQAEKFSGFSPGRKKWRFSLHDPFSECAALKRTGIVVNDR